MTRYHHKPPKSSELLHLSFDPQLPKVLKPKHPDVSATFGVDPVYGEKDMPPRVCFSPTVQGCFSAIYPNIAHLFEEKHYPYIDCYLYEGIATADIKIIDSTLLNKHVWDASITGEIAVITPIEVKPVYKLRIIITDEELFCHPFGDKSQPKKFVSPKIKYTVIKKF